MSYSRTLEKKKKKQKMKTELNDSVEIDNFYGLNIIAFLFDNEFEINSPVLFWFSLLSILNLPIINPYISQILT